MNNIDINHKLIFDYKHTNILISWTSIHIVPSLWTYFSSKHTLKMNIHEGREEAVSYYESGPRRIRGLVHQFFDAMDTNGDGGVHFYEIHDFLEGRRFLTLFLNRRVFNDLDEDGYRSLDFYEFITFFHMIMMFDCDEYDQPLAGQRHFTCEICLTSPHPNSTLYNVCGSCYNRGYFPHRHHRPWT